MALNSMNSMVVANAKLEELLIRWLTQSDEFSAAFEDEIQQLANGTWKESLSRPLSAQAAESPPAAPAASKTPSTPNSGKRQRKSFTATPPRPLASLVDDLSRTMSALPAFYNGLSAQPSADDARLLEELEATIGDLTVPMVLEDFEMVSKVCGLCAYFAPELYAACGGTETTGVWAKDFIEYWTDLSQQHHDLESKLIAVINPEEGALLPDDWRDMVTYVLHEHPGLEFLAGSPEYHERYIDTVIARIYYTCDRTWNKRLTASELRSSRLLERLHTLDDEYNINKELDFFSYEHFYVIYTSFWKLDKDHDLTISQLELMKYGDGGLSPLVLDRIFSQTVFAANNDSCPGGSALCQRQPSSDRLVIHPSDVMTYWDFVYFILSEEDKTSTRSCEYWFRILDLDGDGQLSIYELELLYNEQLLRLDELGIEALAFRDCLCQCLDMVNPRDRTVVRLGDLKQSGKARDFLNTFVNVNKYLDAEEGGVDDPDGPQMSDWVRFAQREYIFLSSEDDVDEDLDMDATLDASTMLKNPLALY
eukprot:TRINITY_DN12341_c6_g1_i3.p1 TRINITY_DN12341_c6_g1~~TRINITY_DN12341_c6_g1_i3.p1  ORF type:complete len:536 (+),score=121.54 TRINITY_DN12341_c6_g1_i3:110-1717(+)